MDESLKMLTEFILEENVSQKEEIRGLKDEVKKLTENNDDCYARLNSNTRNRMELKKILSKYARWENGKLQSISIYNDEALETINYILWLTENDKATF